LANILTDKYEINKPSYLTQIVYFNTSTKELEPVNPIHLDLVNSMYYMVNKLMHSQTMDTEAKNRILDCAQDDIGSEVFEIKMQDVSGMIGKYSKGQYSKIIKKIHELRHIDVVINALNKDKDMTRTTASIIGNINEIDGKNKSIKAQFPRVLVKSYYNTQKYFKKQYLTIQFSLKSKYSKLLYELAKDYEGLENGKTVDMNDLQDLLNVTTESMKAPSRFKAHILKKSVDEINVNTDIMVECEMKKKSKGEYDVIIKAYPQSKERLGELGLLESLIESNPNYDRAIKNLEIRKQRGQEIYDEQAWIKEDLRRNSENYEAMDVIDEFIQDNTQEVKNDFYFKIAEMLKAEDPLLIIKDYKVKEMIGDKIYTNNAIETQNLMENVMKKYYD